jgi:hypothetical protein
MFAALLPWQWRYVNLHASLKTNHRDLEAYPLKICYNMLIVVQLKRPMNGPQFWHNFMSRNSRLAMVRTSVCKKRRAFMSMVSGLLGYLSQSCAFAKRHTFFFAVYLCIIYSSLRLSGDGITQLLTERSNLQIILKESGNGEASAIELSSCAFLFWTGDDWWTLQRTNIKKELSFQKVPDFLFVVFQHPGSEC